MKKIFSFIFLVLIIPFSNAQTFLSAYQNRVNQVSQISIHQNLQEFVNFGIKTTGSSANTNTFNWLKSKYSSYGYTSSQITEHSFSVGNVQSKNLIITKTGTVYPNTFVIVCSHYDTINGVGANDNGSGTVSLLEMAKILKDVPTEYSIKFIHFSGEEQGLHGSQHYVNDIVNGTNPKMDIKLVFNIDQVGGVSGQTHNRIICERDTNNNPSTNNAASNLATQQLMNCVTLYSPLQTSLSYAYSSDYMPFQSNNEIITGFYEYQGSSNNYPHTSQDTIANLDLGYLTNVTKAALGAVQHFATASTVLSTENLNSKKEELIVYPNPTLGKVFLKFNDNLPKQFHIEWKDNSGKLLLQAKNVLEMDISNFQNGIYYMTVSYEEKKETHKIILQK